MRRIHAATIVLGLLVVGMASYWWNRRLSHDLAHDIPVPAAQQTVPPAESVEPATSRESARPPDAAARHMPPRHHQIIHGTKADDVLYGTESGEQIESLAGRDRIVARGGDDVLDGGNDADVLMGGTGNDTYVVSHHGGGADIIVEESGTDTLQIAGRRVALAAVEILRHGDDLLIRWNHDSPLDMVMIRSWFVSERFHVERLQLSDGAIVPLEPLAARAKEATSEDVVHFTPLPAPRSE